MTYQVALAPAAARQLRKFDPQVRRRIQAAIELLAPNRDRQQQRGWSAELASGEFEPVTIGSFTRSRTSASLCSS
jgi:hypothetical protein